MGGGGGGVTMGSTELLCSRSQESWVEKGY